MSCAIRILLAACILVALATLVIQAVGATLDSLDRAHCAAHAIQMRTDGTMEPLRCIKRHDGIATPASNPLQPA